jgi:hypothetical protein
LEKRIRSPAGENLMGLRLTEIPVTLASEVQIWLDLAAHGKRGPRFSATSK